MPSSSLYLGIVLPGDTLVAITSHADPLPTDAELANQLAIAILATGDIEIVTPASRVPTWCDGVVGGVDFGGGPTQDTVVAESPLLPMPLVDWSPVTTQPPVLVFTPELEMTPEEIDADETTAETDVPDAAEEIIDDSIEAAESDAPGGSLDATPL